jgi:small subunit ribosomal protein S1
MDYLSQHPALKQQLGFPVARPPMTGFEESIQFFENGVITTRDNQIEVWFKAQNQDTTVEIMDMDRKLVSLKTTQEDPWHQFARMHEIGQIVSGQVTKLTPSGAFVRVEEGIEGLVHISELADRPVKIPEQVIQEGDEIFVKIIAIDLDRCPISLSLKQANEGQTGDLTGDGFDPTLYGMPATYDEQGNYVYPDGFEPNSGEWLEGFETQRNEWERQYSEARVRFEAHQRHVAEARRKAQGKDARHANSHTSGPPETDDSAGQALTSDEALATLSEKLSGGHS